MIPSFLKSIVVIATVLVFGGCASSEVSNQSPKTIASSVEYLNATEGAQSSFLYNRPANLEYMDVKSIEKLKRAVSLLIDKVEQLENKKDLSLPAQQNVQQMSDVNEEDAKIIEFINRDKGNNR